LGKRIITGILVTVAIIAVLFSSSSVFAVRAQANNMSSNSTVLAVSTPILNATVTSTSTSYSSLDSTTSSTQSTEETSVATSSDPITSTSTSTASNLTSWTSTLTYSLTSTYSSWTTVTASTTTVAAISETSTSTTDPPGYSISFNPQYWYCTPVSVTFTGPLVESGYYGDTLQFQYFQYNPSYPSVLTPIFTDSGLTVTSDTVNYWVGYSEYAPVNFAYSPNLAVKVVDVTPKSNGYAPGLLFMQLTNTTPESSQYCPYDPPIPTPEFQADWLVILASVFLSLVFLRVHKYQRYHEKDKKADALEIQRPTTL